VAPEHPPLPAEEATNGARRDRRRLVLAVAVAYLAAWGVGIGYGYLLLAAGDWQGAPWERDVLRWFHERPLPPLLDRLMLVAPLFGTNLTVLPAMLVVGWWLWKTRREPITGVHLLVVSVGSLSLNPTMKYLLDRDRPSLYPLRGMYNWASYPSGHAILTTALYFTIAMLLLRRRGWRWPLAAAAIVVLLTCYSRLYLAVHWPTDLIGGLLIGLVWLLGTWRAFREHLVLDRIPPRRTSAAKEV
jgi:membrane-associated phospholipid phosphatase